MAPLYFSAASFVAERKTNVDLRVGEKSLPAEISDGGKYNLGRFRVGGNEKLGPETLRDGFHQRRSFLTIFQAISCGGKIELEPRGFGLVMISQFTAE